MTMMRAAVLRGVHDLAIEERPVPRPGTGEVLVRVSAVGVCGSDVHYYEHGRIGDFVVESPMVLGHESSGVILSVGDEVAPERVGERVSIEPGVPDLTCEQCLAGRYNLCPAMRFYATPPIDGSLAEFVVVHASFAHPVPDTMSDDAAALLEPLSVGLGQPPGRNDRRQQGPRHGRWTGWPGRHAVCGGLRGHRGRRRRPQPAPAGRGPGARGHRGDPGRRNHHRRLRRRADRAPRVQRSPGVDP